MAVSRKAMTEGIRTPIFLCALIDAVLQSLSQKSKIFASSLYTREPGCSRTSAFFNGIRKNREIAALPTKPSLLAVFSGCISEKSMLQ